MRDDPQRGTYLLDWQRLTRMFTIDVQAVFCVCGRNEHAKLKFIQAIYLRVDVADCLFKPDARFTRV
jgi:hypothetical protein